MSAISVSLASSAITLGPDDGSVTVSVTNAEPVAQRVVLGVYGARPDAPDVRSWTRVERPLRQVAAGATEQYVLALDRAGAPAGTHELKVVAYPADRAPEEYSDLGQVLQVVVPAAEAPAPRRPRWWLYVLVAVLVLAVAAVAVLLLRARGPSDVAVPDVAGSSQAEARAALAAAGITGVVSTATVDAPGTAQDVVVGTEPAAGEAVPPGDPLLLVLATGRVEVPDLVGSRDTDAEAALTELGLQVAFSGSRPGTVVGQDPSGLVAVDATVALTIDPDEPFEPPCSPWPACILPPLEYHEFPDRVFEPGF